ncbi:hypothetical protein [Rhizobium sp. RCC_161_2]|uniref:hypothetical protein n=1 Tax=Rhizobium sp. RCC_161_2 TaxID=3239219 RepID=UPI0035264F33
MLAHDLIQEPLHIFGNHAVVSRFSAGHRNQPHMITIDDAAQQKAGGWMETLRRKSMKLGGRIC